LGGQSQRPNHGVSCPPSWLTVLPGAVLMDGCLATCALLVLAPMLSGPGGWAPQVADDVPAHMLHVLFHVLPTNQATAFWFPGILSACGDQHDLLYSLQTAPLAHCHPCPYPTIGTADQFQKPKTTIHASSLSPTSWLPICCWLSIRIACHLHGLLMHNAPSELHSVFEKLRLHLWNEFEASGILCPWNSAKCCHTRTRHNMAATARATTQIHHWWCGNLWRGTVH
jgi:hypothetical protein